MKCFQLNQSGRLIVVLLLCILPICGTFADNQLHSQNLIDSYSWMETDLNRTTRWLQRRTTQSRERIDALSLRTSVAQQLSALVGAEDTLSDFYDAGENRFYLQSTAEFPYQRLFVRQKDGQNKLLVDPPPGMGIHFFSPSHDGRYIAYGLSENGSEITAIEILEVVSGIVLQERIPNVRYPQITWRNDNCSFFIRACHSLAMTGRNQSALQVKKYFCTR
jgi:prolyl oligopeptidase